MAEREVQLEVPGSPSPSHVVMTDAQPTTAKAVSHRESASSPVSSERFSLMVSLLNEARRAGRPQMLRSQLSVQLKQHNPDVFVTAGVFKFKDYAALAEQHGVVELGGSEGSAWIALRPEWYSQGRDSEP